MLSRRIERVLVHLHRCDGAGGGGAGPQASGVNGLSARRVHRHSLTTVRGVDVHLRKRRLQQRVAKMMECMDG